MVQITELTFPFLNLLQTLLLLVLPELLHDGVDHVVDGEDSVLVPHGLATLGTRAEVAAGPPVAVLPLGEAEPAVRMAAIK